MNLEEKVTSFADDADAYSIISRVLLVGEAIEIAKEYAETKCKEQISLCQDSYENGTPILDTPLATDEANK